MVKAILEGWKHGCDAVLAGRIKREDDCLLHGMKFFVSKETDTEEPASVQDAAAGKEVRLENNYYYQLLFDDSWLDGVIKKAVDHGWIKGQMEGA